MARLKRTSRGSYILPNKERITIKEQKALRSAVVSANRKRKRMLENLPKRAKEKYKDFGVESDFIMRKKSTNSLRQLKQAKQEVIDELLEWLVKNYNEFVYDEYSDVYTSCITQNNLEEKLTELKGEWYGREKRLFYLWLLS